jgi:hypothetical protein
MTGVDGKTLAHMPVVANITRMRGEERRLLTFDKTGGRRTISEVWLPNRDGALVYANKSARAQDTVLLVKSPQGDAAPGGAGAVGTR